MSYVSKSAAAQKGRGLAEAFPFPSSGEGFGCFSVEAGVFCLHLACEGHVLWTHGIGGIGEGLTSISLPS